MAWDIEVMDECAVVRMNTNKVNVQNEQFFADLHRAFDRLEREFSDLPVVLTGQGDVFSAGIDFQYSFGIFGSGSHDKIRAWYRGTAKRICASSSDRRAAKRQSHGAPLLRQRASAA